MDEISRVPPLRRSPGAVASLSRTPLAAPSTNVHNATLTALWEGDDIAQVQLVRTRDGRNLSRARFQRAHEFMRPLEPGSPGNWPDFLYSAGIVAQLALSSHLLDVGFRDDWCARHIGLFVSSSLAYANATGLGLECPETARLAQVLSPYSQWNCLSLVENLPPNDGGFTHNEIRSLLRAMMDHVGHITGHAPRRPRVRCVAS